MTVIYYDDGRAVSKKIGEITKQDHVFIHMRTREGELLRIPISRIVRIEEK